MSDPVDAGRLPAVDRRRFLQVAGGTVLAASAAGVLAACGGGSEEAASTAAAAASGGASSSAAQSGGELVIANWKGYGSDLDWVAEDFKKRTGASLVHRYIDSEAAMIELLKRGEGEIDVALPNLQFIGQAITPGLLAPLDLAKIPSTTTMYPQLLAQDGLKADGQQYGVPWVWGTSSLFYADDVDPLDSVAALWDPAFKGKVAVVDDPTLNVLLAGLYLGEDPQNPDLEKVEQALRELKANAKLIYVTVDDLGKALSSKSVQIGIVASSYVGTLQSQGLGITYVIPKEGAIGWIDNWTIVKGTKREALAYEWISYITDPATLARWAGDAAAGAPAPANPTALEGLDAASLDRLQAHPETLDTLALQAPMAQDKLQAWIDLEPGEGGVAWWRATTRRRAAVPPFLLRRAGASAAPCGRSAPT